MAFNNFPYTDFHEINLSWVIGTYKDALVKAEEALTTAKTTKTRVDNFFDNLDLTDEVNDKIDEMYENGDFDHIFDQYQKLTGDVVIVSASFGKTNPIGDNTITPFTAQCKTRIETYTNRKCYWNAIGGKGFHNDGFLDVLEGLENTITDKNSVSVILVAGGGNDITVNPDEPTGTVVTDADIEDGMQNFMAYVKANYPNAQVMFFWLTWLMTYQAWRPQRAIIDMIEKFKKFCPRNGIAYCTNSEYVYHQYYDDWYLSDHYHPTTLASRYIADAVMDCIITGSCSVSRREEVEAFLYRPDDYASNPIRDQPNVYIVQENDITTITFERTPPGFTFRCDHKAGYYKNGEATETASAFFKFDSDLYKAFIPIATTIKFPVNIAAVGLDGNNEITKFDMFNGSGMFSASYGYIAAVKTDQYNPGTPQNPNYTEDWFFLPGSITVPTMYA